ncbi:MAG TPA: hypothetical protein VHY37_12930, partial [Tepidisphaeraceae bacterium]|nr:hypothetical protein [Tepidisphaeraceae bacterium]
MSDQEKLDLQATIDALVPKILEHRHEQIPEEQTKQSLIAPVLTALGWHIHDSGEVRYEYRANPQCNPVDYGLMVHG